MTKTIPIDLKASPVTRRRSSDKLIVPNEAEKSLDAAHESDVLKMLRWQMAENPSKSMFQLFAPMVKIQTSGTVKSFNPYLYQSKLISTIETNKQILIVKSRQMGISETVCGYLLMRSVTEPGFAAVVISKSQDDSAKLGMRIRNMAISLGSLCPEITTESAKKLAFAKLGSIDFLSAKGKASRGIASVSVIFFDEAAFIDEIDGIYQASMPTMSMLGDRGKVIFNSTPNGKVGLFYRLLSGDNDEPDLLRLSKTVAIPTNTIEPFQRSSESSHTETWKTKDWAKVILHWRAHPIYGGDPLWADKTRDRLKLTQAQWNQEFELEFAEGSTSVFPNDLVKICAVGAWSEPNSSQKYIIGIDPNAGGDDYFVTQVWELYGSTYSLVAESRYNRCSKMLSLQRTIELIDKYNPINVNVETNSGGTLILQDLILNRPKVQFGAINTSHQSKILNTDRMVLLLERQTIEYPEDSALASELLHFAEKRTIGKSRTREAEAGFHDDTVMAAAIAFAGIDEWGSGIGKVNAIGGIFS